MTARTFSSHLLLVAATLAFSSGCAHSPVSLRADDASLGWPTSTTPLETRVTGQVYQAIRTAARDFLPQEPGGPFPPPRAECLSFHAAYDYRIIHDEAKRRYFVYMSPSDYCRETTFDASAEYAIDDTTWAIQGKRTAWEVPPLYRPYLAALVLTGGPTCRGTPSGLQFGMTGTSTPVERTVYVRNIGERPATSLVDGNSLGNGFGFKGGTYPGTGGTCGTSLPGGEICTIVLTFESQEADPRSILTLNYHDGSTHRRAAQNVFAITSDKAVLVITDWRGSDRGSEPGDAPYDYPAAGVPVHHTFHVRNIGAQPATALGDGGGLDHGFGFKGGAYPGTGGTCGASLVPGEACTLAVTFTPGDAGTQASSLALAYHDGEALQEATRHLTGTATLRASLAISDFGSPGGCGDACSPFHFGTAELGTAKSHAFTITNTGSVATTHLLDAGVLSAPFSYAGGTFPGTAGTCTSRLPPGSSCTVVLQFNPTTSGTSLSSLTITYADDLGPTLEVKRAVLGAGQ